jgi:anti-sigma regulatory factor (Ser/Thr protein kinase)
VTIPGTSPKRLTAGIGRRREDLVKVRAPYLFGGDDGAGRPHVTATGDVENAVVELAVHGRWSQRLGVDVSAGVRKCLAEHPVAVIADLHDMGDPKAASVAIWLAARRAGTALQPPVPLVLSLSPGTVLADRLERLGVRRYLPMFATMPEARASVADRRPPVSDLMQLRLPPDLESPSAARNLVGDACQAWQLPDLLHPGRLVLSELVTNAVEHAGTEILVTVSRRGTGMHLSVHDGSPQLPRLLQPAPMIPGAPLDDRGQGLRIVHAGSAAWGSMPARDGKVVWATLYPRAGDLR